MAHLEERNGVIYCIEDNFEWVYGYPKTLDEVKQDKLSELEQSYQSAVSTATFTSSATGTSKVYPVNEEAYQNLLDLQQRLIADANKSVFSFLSLTDRILINHTRSQFLQLLDDGEARRIDLHNQNRTFANRIADATDIANVQSMTFTFS